MRQLASFLLIGFAVAAGATETWTWKDENGVHFSDRPVPGATRVDVATQPRSSTPPRLPSTPTSTAQRGTAVGEVKTIPYTSCTVVSPLNDAVFNLQDAVGVTLQIEPGLQPQHRIQVFLNAQNYAAWPETAMGYTLNNLFRGSYAVNARVVDVDGKPMCTGPSIQFHIRQPSLLSPARQSAVGK